MRSLGVVLCVVCSMLVVNATPPSAYVANFSDNTVSVIDTTAVPPDVIATIPVGVGPFGLGIPPSGNPVYVADAGGNTVTIIDAALLSVIGTIPVGNGPSNVVFTLDGAFAYVTNGNDASITVINTASSTVVNTIPVQTNPHDMAITPDGNFIYVTNTGSDSVSVIATASQTVVDTIALPVGSAPFDVTIIPTGFAYVANHGNGTVSVINTTNNTVLPSPITVGTNPDGIASTPNGSFIYVANVSSGTVSVIQSISNTVIATVTLPGSPGTPIVVAVTLDGNFAYVTNAAGSGTVNVIDVGTQSLTGSPIDVGMNPNGISMGPMVTMPIVQVQPPTSFQGRRKKNNFGTVSELFNRLSWVGSPSSVAGYYLMRNGQLIATLSPTAVSYRDNDRIKSQADTYTLVAFNSRGAQSAAVSVTVSDK